MTENQRVRDPQGREATLVERSANGTLLLLRADDGREAWIDPQLVDGERLTLAVDALLASGETLRLVEERLVVGRQVEETGVVRVRKQTVERPETVRLETFREAVDIVRIPKDEVVPGLIGVRYEGDTTVISVVEERLVVERRLVLIEEVRLTRRRETAAEERTFVLKREEAVVEREPSARQE